MSAKRLQGKVALVTGSAQGIGKEIAKLFSKEGSTVLVSDINEEKGNQVAKEIGTTYYSLDVREEKSWHSVTANIQKQFGKLDILVNNAGITGFQEGFGPQDPEHASLQSWHAVHAVNSDGVFLGCKHTIPLLQKSKSGSIVNISSRSGLVGIPGAAAYAASKAAMCNHTKTIALYCCEKGYPIRCNSIHPAAILTPMWDPMLGSGEIRKENIAAITRNIPMGQMGTPEDVAYAALFLASDEAKYITGIELSIDGGILAGSTASPKRELS